MRVLGIDPGIAITGYGIVENQGNRLEALDCGAINTSSDLPFQERLEKIYDELSSILARWKPDVVAVEELFFATNVKTAFSVGQARGVALLSSVKAGLEVAEYKPTEVKQAVVGYGRAEKSQVQKMVKVLLNLKEIPKPDDAADALAVAICHINSAKFSNL